MAESVFRKESLKKVSSPEKLNEYIRVSSPSVWLIIAAAAVLLIAMLVWAVFGSLDTTVTAVGVANGNTITCYLADATGVSAGQEVTVGNAKGTVLSVSEKPLSYADTVTHSGADDYTVYRLALSDWNYIVELSVPSYTGDEFVSARIVTERVSPISFVLD